MTEKIIMLRTIKDVKEFVDITNGYDFECDITIGKYVVDAKSIMGLFSLDLSKALTVRIHSDNAKEYLGKIERFAV